MGKEVIISGGRQAVTKLNVWVHLQDAEDKQNIRELQLHKIKNMLIGKLFSTSKKPWLGN